MFQEEFNKIVSDQNELLELELADVRAICERYPYCQVAQVLYAKKLHIINNPQFENQIKKAAANVYDRTILFKLIEKTILNKSIPAGYDDEHENTEKYNRNEIEPGVGEEELSKDIDQEIINEAQDKSIPEIEIAAVNETVISIPEQDVNIEKVYEIIPEEKGELIDEEIIQNIEQIINAEHLIPEIDNLNVADDIDPEKVVEEFILDNLIDEEESEFPDIEAEASAREKAAEIEGVHETIMESVPELTDEKELEQEIPLIREQEEKLILAEEEAIANLNENIQNEESLEFDNGAEIYDNAVTNLVADLIREEWDEVQNENADDGQRDQSEIIIDETVSEITDYDVNSVTEEIHETVLESIPELEVEKDIDIPENEVEELIIAREEAIESLNEINSNTESLEEEEVEQSGEIRNDKEEPLFDLPAYDIERELGALKEDEIVRINIQKPVIEEEKPEEVYADSFVGWLNRLSGESKGRLVISRESNKPIKLYRKPPQQDAESNQGVKPEKVISELYAAELAKKSLESNENLATETLARILVMQGKYPKAIEMYSRLSLLKPKKSDYFAALIDQIKKRIK
ncbi:MAG: hypothetical protein ACHQFW_00380 [Chitinophagales bacterium]